MDMKSQNVMKTLYPLENWTRYVQCRFKPFIAESHWIPKALKQGEYVLQSMELENNSGHMWFIPGSLIS